MTRGTRFILSYLESSANGLEALAAFDPWRCPSRGTNRTPRSSRSVPHFRDRHPNAACYLRPMADESKPAPRGKPFAKGKSGNPNGRPRGSLNKTTAALRQTLEENGAQILDSLMNAARDGKPWAVKLSIDRLIRVRPDRFVSLPDVTNARTATEVADATADVLRLVCSGEISLEDGRAMMVLLEQQRAACETADLSVRLQALDEENAELTRAEKKGRKYL